MSSTASGVDVLMALAGRAKAGELVLDPDVAQDCVNACNEAIAALQENQHRMRSQTYKLPLGNFTCGHDLATILSETTQQFIDRLDEHITCLKAIHDMVGAQVATTLTTDEQTSQAMGRITGEIAS